MHELGGFHVTAVHLGTWRQLYLDERLLVLQYLDDRSRCTQGQMHDNYWVRLASPMIHVMASCGWYWAGSHTDICNTWSQDVPIDGYACLNLQMPSYVAYSLLLYRLDD